MDYKHSVIKGLNCIYASVEVFMPFISLVLDHTARIWNAESGKCVLQYSGHQGSVNAIRFNPVQDLVVTTSGDETAHIWCPKATLPSHDSVVSIDT